MAPTKQEVLSFLAPVIGTVKNRNQKKRGKRITKILGQQTTEAWTPPTYDEYWKGYVLAAKWFDEIKPHAQIGYFPESLFAKRAPNERPEETVYIRENYQQITMSVFKDYVEINGRPLQPNNWDIQYEEDERQYLDSGETLQEFMENMIPNHTSLENFCFSFLPPLKYMDAMGVVVIKPTYIPTEVVDSEEIISQQELILPAPYFFHTTRVIHYSDELAIIEWDEFSDVLVGDKLINEGIVYYAFTLDAIYRIFQTGKKEDYDFSIEVFWQHNLNMLAVKRVDGTSVQIDDVKLQMSPFMYAVPTLNDVLIDSCMLRGIKAMCCYPYRIMVGDPCDAQIIVEGEQIGCDGLGYFQWGTERRTCTTCHGTGMKDRVSPYGTLLIKRVGNVDAGDGIDPTKAMFYASPGVDMPELIRKEIEHGFTKSYNTLHIQRSEVQPDSAAKEVTATEDLGRQKALIASISVNKDQLFDMFEWCVVVSGKMRYGDRFKKPRITRPTNLDIFVESDDLKKINEAIQAGQPPFVIQTLIFNYLRKLYYNDAESKLVFDLILNADRLITQGTDEINAGLQRGNVQEWEKILHDSAISFINQLKMENPAFFEQDPQTQITQLQDKAKEIAATIKPVSAVPTGQQRITDILGG